MNSKKQSQLGKDKALSPSERALLLKAGLKDSELKTKKSREHSLTEMKLTQLVEDSYQQDAVAKLLKLDPEAIGQMRIEKKLYAFEHQNVYFYPRFQFAHGSSLLHLETILEALREDFHPLAGLSFFTLIHQDLETETGETLCPRDWIINSKEPESILPLIIEL